MTEENTVPLGDAERRRSAAIAAASAGEHAGDGPPFPEEQIALIFAARHKDDLRHVAAWGKWLLWEEERGRWRIDDTLHVFDRARRLCREQSLLVSIARVADDIASAKTV